MQLANIMLSLGGDAGNTIPKFGVTPAEIAVLRVIHGEESVTDIEPVPGEPVDEDSGRPRTHRQEIARLTQAYGRMQPNGQRAAPAVAQLFPGAAARVFDTLDELELPEEFFKAERRVATTTPAAKPAKPVAAPKREPAPTKAADKKEPGLGDLTLAQLKEFAAVNQIDIFGLTKKADIAERISEWEDAQKAPQPTEDPQEDDGIGDMADGQEDILA